MVVISVAIDNGMNSLTIACLAFT